MDKLCRHKINDFFHIFDTSLKRKNVILKTKPFKSGTLPDYIEIFSVNKKEALTNVINMSIRQ